MGEVNRHSIKIGISGSAVFGGHKEIVEESRKIGKLLAKRGVVVVTGDTTGIPLEAAKGAKEAGGFVVGISPASSYLEHAKK